MKHFGLLLTVAAMTGLAATSALAQQAPVSFIGVGDLPYGAAQEPAVTNGIAPAIQAFNTPFVVHWGDFKASAGACTDAEITKARDQIYGFHTGPVYFSPGDNDWTDCDRPSTGDPMDELGRLSEVRKVFFTKPPVAPADFKEERQANYPENALWSTGGVVFATIHVVGTNNGRDQILLDDLWLALSRVDARDHANRVWIDKAVARARLEEAGALVFVAQADITKPWGAGACTKSNPQKCDAFMALRDDLRQAAAQFGGPTLYLHGDTSPFCLDKNFGQKTAPNLWRMNGSGDYAVIDATVVTVDPADAAAPFKAKTLMGGDEIPVGC